MEEGAGPSLAAAADTGVAVTAGTEVAVAANTGIAVVAGTGSTELSRTQLKVPKTNPSQLNSQLN